MGLGSDESIILGIDKACDLAEAARKKGLWPTDEMYPNVINLSLGAGLLGTIVVVNFTGKKIT